MSEDLIPDYLSREWPDYVMGLFEPDELMDGYPTTVGLRRVAELVLGPISKSGPTQVFPVDGNGPGRATVVYEVVFSGFLNSIQVRSYSEVADVWLGNTDAMYAGYAVATAATRAEGRALRKALKLRKCAAEELTKQDVAAAVAGGSADAITPDQISFIDTKCKKLNVNVFALINSLGKASIYNVTKQEAAQLIKSFTNFEVTPQLLGYESWRS